MEQLPVGGGVAAGGTGGITVLVQPSRASVTVGVRPPSEMVILQSGAVKLLPWILYRPVGSARTAATLVVDSADTKTPGELSPSRRSWPLISSAFATVT